MRVDSADRAEIPLPPVPLPETGWSTLRSEYEDGRRTPVSPRDAATVDPEAPVRRRPEVYYMRRHGLLDGLPPGACASSRVAAWTRATTPAVWFSWDLSAGRSPRDNHEWVTVEERSTCAPFWLQDDTGRVLVRPAARTSSRSALVREKLDGDFAPPYSRWQLRQWRGPPRRGHHRAHAEHVRLLPRGAPTVDSGWFDTTPDTASAISSLSGKHRITEKVIAAGAPIYLLGTANPRTDGPGLEFSGRSSIAGAAMVNELRRRYPVF